MQRARCFDGGIISGDSVTVSDLLSETIDDIVDGAAAGAAAYLAFTMDVTAGVSILCRPAIDVVLGASMLSSDGTGTWREIAVLDEISMQQASPGWQNFPISGDPVLCVLEGATQIHLYGTPATSISGGLVIRGFGEYSDAIWPNPTDVGPFPARWSSCIITGLAWRMCLHEADAEHLARAASLVKTYVRMKGAIWAQVSKECESRQSRSAIPSWFGPSYSSGDQAMNPFNW